MKQRHIKTNKQDNEKILHTLADEIIKEARKTSEARFAVMKVRLAEFAKKEGITIEMVKALADNLGFDGNSEVAPESFVEFELRQMIERNVRNMKGE